MQTMQPGVESHAAHSASGVAVSSRRHEVDAREEVAHGYQPSPVASEMTNVD